MRRDRLSHSVRRRLRALAVGLRSRRRLMPAIAVATVVLVLSGAVPVPFAWGAPARGTAVMASAAAVPVPAVDGPLPADGRSYPFNSASRQVVPVDLAEHGYVEEEYFLSGTANVYAWDRLFETVTVRTPNAPYTNRILVRRPADPRTASGTAVVELLNYQGLLGYESPFIWADSWQHIVDRGHVWIGVTANPGALRALKTFDPVRYAPLSWSDPLPPEQRCSPGRDTEAGLLWDILSQVAALVKSDDPSNPLRRYGVERAYATGQLGGGWPLYTNTIGPIAKTAHGEPVYDGYVIKASGSHAGPINQCAPVPPATHPIAASRSPQPVIRLMGHSDVLRDSATHPGSSCDFRRPDSDDVHPYRHYEIAGLLVSATHQVTGAPGPEDGSRAGGVPIPSFVVPPNEFPFRYILNGTLDSMDRWVRDGVPPPHARFLQEATLDCRSLVLDERGTPRGGVRTPYVDVAINTYPPDERPATPLAPELIVDMYGSHGRYVRLVTRKTIDLVRDGWITPKDGTRIIVEAMSTRDLFR